MTAVFTFEHACEIARNIVSGAIQNFAKDGEVYPVSFVLGTKDPRTGRLLPKPALAVVDLSEVHARGKDAVRSMQQELCDRMGAVAHIYVSEGWSVTLSEGATYEDPYEGHDSLAQHPDRVEVILIVLEHKDGDAMWRLPILRDGPKPTLGPVEEDTGMTAAGRNMGRMTGYVRKQVEA